MKEKQNDMSKQNQWLDVTIDTDFGLIVNSAVRYSIGRNTYMPSVVHDFIIRNMSFLDSKTLENVIADIDRYVRFNSKESLEESWCHLRFCINNELENRKVQEIK